MLFHSPDSGASERAEPGALVLLAGGGLSADDRVLLQREGSTAVDRLHIVATHLIPDALIVRMPAHANDDVVYRIWVRAQDGTESSVVRLNDVRGHWFSPARMPSSGRLAALPRELRIVGRNFDLLRDAARLRARLRNVSARPAAQVVSLGAALTESDAAIARHVVRFSLPAALVPGRYSVELSSDGGARWSNVSRQEFIVERAVVRRVVDLPRSCRVDDGKDDSACLLAAIAQLRNAQGGDVRLPAGTIDLAQTPPQSVRGIELPRGVGLIGAGVARTKILRGPRWSADALFTLLGSNRVSGIRFEDSARVRIEDERHSVLVLGPPPGADAGAVTDFEVYANAFMKVNRAIVSGGRAIERLVIVDNAFGAYRDALLLDAWRGAPGARFSVRDSIIRSNRFVPGGFVDCANGQGTIASQLGASERVDFSANLADGRSRAALHDGESPGWRAAFFWHLLGPQEDVLVSANRGSCTGDKAGDGEFLAFDNNGNTTPLAGLDRSVRAAAKNWVRVAIRETERAGWISQWWGAPVDDSFYAGHWLFVAAGHGLGQARRVSKVLRANGLVTFEVERSFDIVPDTSSRVVVTRAFRRLLVLGNESDGRRCVDRNANRGVHSGAIGLWASASGSVIAGNRMFRSGGILLQSQYNADAQELFLQYQTEIRGNSLEGEQQQRSSCSTGGIQLHHSARTWTGGAPPQRPRVVPIVQGYGVRVVDNLVRGADGLRGGAIVFPDSWHRVPGSRMYLGTIISGNTLLDVPRLPATPTLADPCRAGTCGSDAPVRGVGVHITDDAIVGTLLENNRAPDAVRAVLDAGRSTLRLDESAR